MNFAVLN